LELHSDNGTEIHLPVCYDEIFAPDLRQIANNRNIDAEDVINIHLSRVYRVYMMGFLPGFAYMGDVDERIQLPRKPQPETVVAGSVGIANAQTGIYPLDSPGGWQIIGRTPVRLFNPQAVQPVKLKAGEFIRFHRITTSEFEEISNSQMF
jgi:inhibitor of KinA